MTDHQDGNVQTFCYRAAAICLDLSNQPSHCRSLKAIPQNFAIAKHYQTALPSQYLYTLQKLRRAPCLNIMCSQAFGSTVTFANTLIWLRKPCLVSGLVPPLPTQLLANSIDIPVSFLRSHSRRPSSHKVQVPRLLPLSATFRQPVFHFSALS